MIGMVEGSQEGDFLDAVDLGLSFDSCAVDVFDADFHSSDLVLPASLLTR